jgi:hypothetical protein
VARDQIEQHSLISGRARSSQTVRRRSISSVRLLRVEYSNVSDLEAS